MTLSVSPEDIERAAKRLAEGMWDWSGITEDTRERFREDVRRLISVGWVPAQSVVIECERIAQECYDELRDRGDVAAMGAKDVQHKIAMRLERLT